MEILGIGCICTKTGSTSEGISLISAYHENEHAMAAHRAHLEELTQQLAEEDTATEEEDEDGETLPYCVVCDKSFKTLNAKLNHENSKQHRKQLSDLKKHMKEEDQVLFGEYYVFANFYLFFHAVSPLFYKFP
ncbi:unnamed protein product [Strongylus vulgaris]|uniref:U1-type domain-containing protein n=1 Tax=Strongylus vulgaris TaxID=40348 RepID=A0A3P7KTW4_STRVU|nr:unnamed protein product [Strongylus vulgaris]